MTKCLRKTTLKEERFTLTHGFRGFSPQVLGSIVSGPVVRQNHHGSRANLLTL
jgi:hypothetical protein